MKWELGLIDYKINIFKFIVLFFKNFINIKYIMNKYVSYIVKNMF